MFIPSYQIHNILKDFTLQLKKKRQGIPAPPPTPAMSPDPLRLTSVVTKVADNIMHRIANLGREDGNEPTVSDAPSRVANGGTKSHPATFDYHLMNRNGAKLRKRLLVRDSRSLVDRFQDLTSAEGTDGDDSA